MLRKPYKFVQHDIAPLETLAGSRVAILHDKVSREVELSREEKNELFTLIRSGNRMYGAQVVALGGYLFDFSGYLRCFWGHKRNSSIYEYWAPDKTSLKAHEGKFEKIVEIA